MKAGLKLNMHFGSRSLNFLTIEKESNKTLTVKAMPSLKSRYEHWRGFFWLFLNTRALLSMEREQKEPFQRPTSGHQHPKPELVLLFAPSPWHATEKKNPSSMVFMHKGRK